MKLPKQAAPVQRTIPTASVSPEQGVQPCGTIDDIVKITGALTPIATGLLGALI